MKVLQIGGGSMGTRRMRDLIKIGKLDVALFDKREDRRKRAREQFSIPVFDTFDRAIKEFSPEVLVISTPPDQHDYYVRFAVENGLHHFCEASIWTYNYDFVMKNAAEKKLVAAPSNTMIFLPIVKKLKEIINSGILGKVQSWHMFLSTYEPAWHSDEGREYYARKRETSAGRDMLAFELTYLWDILGRDFSSVYAHIGRRGETTGNFEDCWNIIVKGGDRLAGSFSLLIGSRRVMRKGWIAGIKGIAEFDILKGLLEVTDDDTHGEVYRCGTQREVLEDAYFEEIALFINAVKGKSNWPLNYMDNAMITAITAAVEKSYRSGKEERVDITSQPSLDW